MNQFLEPELLRLSSLRELPIKHRAHLNQAGKPDRELSLALIRLVPPEQLKLEKIGCRRCNKGARVAGEAIVIRLPVGRPLHLRQHAPQFFIMEETLVQPGADRRELELTVGKQLNASKLKWYNKINKAMGKNRRLYIIVSLASTAALFFLVRPAAAYEVKVNLNTLGGGTGDVTFAAASSNDFEFSGWSGESCAGRAPCALRGLNPNSSKTVIAVFNVPVCTEFTYSEFSACQLDGMTHRVVISAGPSGCVGGNPVTSQGCFYDPCASAQEVKPPSLFDRFKDVINGIVNGIDSIINGVGGGVYKVVNGILDSAVRIAKDIPGTFDKVVGAVTRPDLFIKGIIEDIRKKPVESAIGLGLSAVIPGSGGLIIGAIKAFSPDGKKAVVATPVFNAEGEIVKYEYVEETVFELLGPIDVTVSEPIEGEISLPLPAVEPLIITARRDKPEFEAEFDFNFNLNFDPNFGYIKTGGGGGCGTGFFHYN